jgi:hypothetical protein
LCDRRAQEHLRNAAQRLRRAHHGARPHDVADDFRGGAVMVRRDKRSLAAVPAADAVPQTLRAYG